MLEQSQTNSPTMTINQTLNLSGVFNPGNKFVKLRLSHTDKPILLESGVVEDAHDRKSFRLAPVAGRRSEFEYRDMRPWILSPHGKRPHKVPEGIGKQVYALPLFIGSVWDSLPAETTSVTAELIVLVHDPSGLKEGIRRNMEGKHTVTRCGRSIDFDITIKAVKREGSGVLTSLPVEATVLQDFGGDTVIVQRVEMGQIVTRNNARPQSICGYGHTGLSDFLDSVGGSVLGTNRTELLINEFIRKKDPTEEDINLVAEYFEEYDRFLKDRYVGISQAVSSYCAIGGLMRSAVCRAALKKVQPNVKIINSPQTADVCGLYDRWFSA